MNKNKLNPINVGDLKNIGDISLQTGIPVDELEKIKQDLNEFDDNQVHGDIGLTVELMEATKTEKLTNWAANVSVVDKLDLEVPTIMVEDASGNIMKTIDFKHREFSGIVPTVTINNMAYFLANERILNGYKTASFKTGVPIDIRKAASGYRDVTGAALDNTDILSPTLAISNLVLDVDGELLEIPVTATMAYDNSFSQADDTVSKISATFKFILGPDNTVDLATPFTDSYLATVEAFGQMDRRQLTMHMKTMTIEAFKIDNGLTDEAITNDVKVVGYDVPLLTTNTNRRHVGINVLTTPKFFKTGVEVKTPISFTRPISVDHRAKENSLSQSKYLVEEGKVVALEATLVETFENMKQFVGLGMDYKTINNNFKTVAIEKNFVSSLAQFQLSSEELVQETALLQNLITKLSDELILKSGFIPTYRLMGATTHHISVIAPLNHPIKNFVTTNGIRVVVTHLDITDVWVGLEANGPMTVVNGYNGKKVNGFNSIRPMIIVSKPPYTLTGNISGGSSYERVVIQPSYKFELVIPILGKITLN